MTSVGVRYIGTIEDVEERGIGAEEKLLGDSATNCMVGVVVVDGDSEVSKSHETPCFAQFPHTGCISSHCKAKMLDKRTAWRYRGFLTLIFRFLHLWQPAFDFLCDRLGGIAGSRNEKIRVRVVPAFANVYTLSPSEK